MRCIAVTVSFVFFLCLSINAYAGNITMNIVNPVENTFVGNTLQIAVEISSSFELQIVQAVVEGLEANLAFSDTAVCRPDKRGMICTPGWEGSISLLGLARGQKTLNVTATDVFGNTAQANTAFIYDQKPELIIDSPSSEFVAHPNLPVKVKCLDDDPTGCASLKVNVNGSIVASGTTDIDQIITLSGDDIMILGFEAEDSVGQLTQDTRTVYLVSNKRLVETETTKGRIWDVKSDRILFMESDYDFVKYGYDYPGTNTLKIRDRMTEQDITVMGEQGKNPQYGFLTPKGAIFLEQSNPNGLSDLIYEWRDGVLINIGHPNCVPQDLRVKGIYATWCEYCLNDPYLRPLYLHNVISGETQRIASGVGTGEVADNGDVVYFRVYTDSTLLSNFRNIYRFREGSEAQLTNDTNLWDTYPLTDGINIVYQKATTSNQTYAIAMYGESGEVILSPFRSEETESGRDYQVNNGWIAYNKPGNYGQPLQVWLRNPEGENTQMTFFSGSSYVESVGPNGELAVSDALGNIYLFTGDIEPIYFGSIIYPMFWPPDQVRDFWSDGQFYIILGCSLFRVDTSPETISLPNAASGPAIGITNVPYTFTTSGSTSSLGNPVEYQFDWKGDGSDLSNWGSASQYKTWTVAGVYNIRVRARSTTDVSVMSSWSNPLTVSISLPKILVTPTTYNFGNVKVKRSKIASFAVKNSGTVNLLISASITGTDGSMFKITSRSGSKTIKPGRTLTIRGAFKPISKGSKSANLEITSNDPVTPTIDIPLSGTGQ